MYSGMAKGTSQAEVTLNSKKIKPIALAIVELRKSEGIRQGGSWLVGWFGCLVGLVGWLVGLVSWLFSQSVSRNNISTHYLNPDHKPAIYGFRWRKHLDEFLKGIKPHKQLKSH